MTVPGGTDVYDALNSIVPPRRIQNSAGQMLYSFGGVAIGENGSSKVSTAFSGVLGRSDRKKK